MSHWTAPSWDYAPTVTAGGYTPYAAPYYGGYSSLADTSYYAPTVHAPTVHSPTVRSPTLYPSYPAYPAYDAPVYAPQAHYGPMYAPTVVPPPFHHQQLPEYPRKPQKQRYAFTVVAKSRDPEAQFRANRALAAHYSDVHTDDPKTLLTDAVKYIGGMQSHRMDPRFGNHPVVYNPDVATPRPAPKPAPKRAPRPKPVSPKSPPPPKPREVRHVIVARCDDPVKEAQANRLLEQHYNQSPRQTRPQDLLADASRLLREEQGAYAQIVEVEGVGRGW
jgi:hypothetical protein